MSYKARSLSGAERRVRQLQKQVVSAHELIRQFHKERVMLAKLAADDAQFFNPLDVFEAQKVRDRILKNL